MRPTEQGQVVDDRLGQIAELAEIAHRGGSVTFAELAAVGAVDQRVMRVLGRRGADGREQHELTSRVGEMVVAADHVRYLHVTVVDDGGEVIARQTVGTQDDEVADDVAAEAHRTADEVVDDDVAIGHAQTHDRRLAGGHAPAHLLGRQLKAKPVVLGHPPRRQKFAAQHIETLLRAEAAVGGTVLKQALGRRAITLAPGALPVRTVLPPAIGAFVPLEPQPVQVAYNRLLEALLGAGDVGVLDAQHKTPAGMAGEKVVEQGGARRTDVQRACRTRCETNSNLRVETYSCSSRVLCRCELLLQINGKSIPLAVRGQAGCRLVNCLRTRHR